MARHDDRDDDEGGGVWLILLLLLLLGLAAFFGWRWWQGRSVEDEPLSPPPVVSEKLDPEPEPDAPLEPDDDLGAFEPEPTPIPEPEPVPLEPREPVRFTVYFELMRAELTPQARAELAARWEDVAGSPIASIDVEGYTDTAGTVAYNEPLSARRARVVRDDLAARGAVPDVIAVSSYGETPSRLAVRTADGVREPLNRRAEITVRFRPPS